MYSKQSYELISFQVPISDPSQPSVFLEYDLKGLPFEKSILKYRGKNDKEFIGSAHTWVGLYTSIYGTLLPIVVAL